jgi:hypothetical protein
MMPPTCGGRLTACYQNYLETCLCYVFTTQSSDCQEEDAVDVGFPLAFYRSGELCRTK